MLSSRLLFSGRSGCLADHSRRSQTAVLWYGSLLDRAVLQIFNRHWTCVCEQDCCSQVDRAVLQIFSRQRIASKSCCLADIQPPKDCVKELLSCRRWSTTRWRASWCGTCCTLSPGKPGGRGRGGGGGGDVSPSSNFQHLLSSQGNTKPIPQFTRERVSSRRYRCLSTPR